MKNISVRLKPRATARRFAWPLRILILAALLGGLTAAPARPDAGAPAVVLEVKGIISGAVKNYVTRGIRYAEERKAPCVIITMDTPGGLMDSMKDIATEMINAKIPVVVYVYPNGATATSAGFFLLMAADFAAMAPDTSTGSAHPVAMGGQMDKTMKEKTTNYAIKYMEQLVRRRGRNNKLARDAVLKSISVTSQEALQKNAIEIIASDINDLLAQLDGRSFVKGERKVFVAYRDQMSPELKTELRKRGLLEKSGGPDTVALDPGGLDEDILADLKEKKLAKDGDKEIVLKPGDLDEDLRKKLEDAGLLHSGEYDNEIELDADKLDDSLKALLQGREEVRDEGVKFTLRTKGSRYELLAWSPREKFFQTIGNPNIAYILMMVGIYAIIFEVTHPGAIFPGAVGALCLLIAFTSFQVIPINTLGLALILAAIVMFVLEVKFISHGLLTIGGMAAMTAGSLLLVDSADPALRVSIPLIISFVGFTALLFFLIVTFVIKTHKKQVATGAQGMIGKPGRVSAPLEPEGKVFVNGEIWNARSENGETIERDARVTVVGIENMEIVVKRL